MCVCVCQRCHVFAYTHKHTGVKLHQRHLVPLFPVPQKQKGKINSDIILIIWLQVSTRPRHRTKQRKTPCSTSNMADKKSRTSRSRDHFPTNPVTLMVLFQVDWGWLWWVCAPECRLTVMWIYFVLQTDRVERCSVWVEICLKVFECNTRFSQPVSQWLVEPLNINQIIFIISTAEWQCSIFKNVWWWIKHIWFWTDIDVNYEKHENLLTFLWALHFNR